MPHIQNCNSVYNIQHCNPAHVYLPALQEEELSDELARQKERDALRKSYIEEMKLRHEQTKAELLQQLTREQALHKEDQSARATCEAQLQTMDAELHDVRKLEADRRERDNQVCPTFVRLPRVYVPRSHLSRAVLPSARSSAQAGEQPPVPVLFWREQPPVLFWHRQVTNAAAGGESGAA